MPTVEQAVLEFANRLGASANVEDAWFDKTIDAWRINGERSVLMELNLLGQQLVTWNVMGKSDASRSVLNELESLLLEWDIEAVDAVTLAEELLGGLLTAIYEYRESHPTGAKEVEQNLLEEMGDETKQLYLPLLSALD